MESFFFFFLENALIRILDDISNEVGSGKWEHMKSRNVHITALRVEANTVEQSKSSSGNLARRREFINANIHVSIIVNQSMSWMTAAL